MRRNRTLSRPSAMSTSADDQRSLPSCSLSRQRPMWWLAATTPGRMPSVTSDRITKKPISVSTRARSPVDSPIRSASRGQTSSGWVCDSSLRYLALPEREWIIVGSR
jgi:hypothetical protein